MSALTPDAAFGDGGRAMLDVFGKFDAPRSIAVQLDGKILVGGFSDRADPNDGAQRGMLARFNADGSLDTTFGGGDGVLTDTPFGYFDAVLPQADGTILVGGDISTIETANGVTTHVATAAVGRLNADGSFDTTFGDGGDGYTRVDFAIAHEEFHTLAVAPDGKIVALTNVYLGTPENGMSPGDDWDFGVARFNADGTRDTSFGGDGFVTTDINTAALSGENATAIAFTPDGKLVIGGGTKEYDNPDDNVTASDGGFALVKYNDDGSLDTSFGTGGKVVTPFDYADAPSWITTGSGGVNALRVTNDGKILAVGESTMGDLTLVRYNADGSVDTSYADDGFKYHWFDAATGNWSVVDGPDGTLRLSSTGDVYLAAAVVDAATGNLVGDLASHVGNDDDPLAGPGTFAADGKLLVAGWDNPATRPLAGNGGIGWQEGSDLTLTRYSVTQEPAAAPQEDDTNTGPGMPTVDARITGRQLVRGGSAYRFKAVFNSDLPIDLDNVRTVSVGGPNGFSEQVDAVKLKARKDGTRVTATYRLAAPGGQFDATDNGQYTIGRVYRFDDADQGSPTTPRTIDAGALPLGSFEVNARVRVPEPSPTPNDDDGATEFHFDANGILVQTR